MSHTTTPPATTAARLDPNMRLAATDTAAITWQDPASPPFQIVGLPWFAQERAYRRLPQKPAEPIPPAVDALANCCAGGQVRFQSDTGRISVRVAMRDPGGMDHISATGESGCDLYVDVGGQPCFYGVTRLDRSKKSYEALLFEHPQRIVRAFTLNLPLYNGINEIRIGLSPDAVITAPRPYAAPGRIICYGTSVTQGGCASRAGMAYTNILGRLLNREVVNLGFSGNGRGEPAVARLVAAVPDPALFLLDYDANCPSAAHIGSTLPEFVRILRERHDAAPILVLSRIGFAHDLLQDEQRRERECRRDVQARFVAGAKAVGDCNIHFLDGSAILGDDFQECTVDGVHPTDLGFDRIARGLEPVIRGLVR
jgi:lysophospholipase L1-like esterase